MQQALASQKHRAGSHPSLGACSANQLLQLETLTVQGHTRFDGSARKLLAAVLLRRCMQLLHAPHCMLAAPAKGALSAVHCTGSSPCCSHCPATRQLAELQSCSCYWQCSAMSVFLRVRARHATVCSRLAQHFCYCLLGSEQPSAAHCRVQAGQRGCWRQAQHPAGHRDVGGCFNARLVCAATRSSAQDARAHPQMLVPVQQPQRSTSSSSLTLLGTTQMRTHRCFQRCSSLSAAPPIRP